MADTLRTSVRRMVEFTLRGGDLLPVSLAAMQEGGRAHRARQGMAKATAERPVRWQQDFDGLSVDIQGRIDLLWADAQPPMVEELKLLSPAAPLPEAPVPVHRMQAVCYAFMLCEELSLPVVAVRVSYVTPEGVVRSQFEESLTHEKSAALFFSMLQPLADFHRLQEQHRARRDASLASLRFPYPAYRAGQREMAVQVYTAIRQKKRLFATLPTGTGKSAATLFPALKALGEGKTPQIFCLTARGTAQLSALDALSRMAAEGMAARWLVITAKEKCCPQPDVRCHPDFCPRAKGYYDRELPALLELCRRPVWSSEDIAAACNEHTLCPFEFSLALAELADVVICDYNYIFDPMVSLKRMAGRPLTLLIDEAHNLPSRVRDMLSAVLSSRDLAAVRRETGKLHGRKSGLYAAMTALLTPLRALEPADAAALLGPVNALIAVMTPYLSAPQAAGYQELFRALLQLRMALERWQAAPGSYRALMEAGARERRLTLLCLDVSAPIQAVTRRMAGVVCFSATLLPLPAMRTLLGGTEEDAVFSLPSPFPPDRLLVLRRAVATRYSRREESAGEIARSILALLDGRAGNYVAYFPSYAYLSLIREALLALRPGLPLNVQGRGMDESARAGFLARMRESRESLLSLCVLGGVFSEGIDLPGSQLIGAAVVGVGLPQVNEVQEALRAHYEETLREGFAFAYRYPGMQKVLQAAGRVIRSEKDAGVVLLLDDRYQEPAYARLLPEHYHPQDVGSPEEIRARTEEFWQSHGIEEDDTAQFGGAYAAQSARNDG